MLVSKLLGERYKEKPNDAQIPSHIFSLRGGYIRQVGGGIFSLLTPGKRISDKISNIIREEMDFADGQEVLFPVVIPADLWKESGRFDAVGSELVRFKDRTGRDMVLGMTHEEPAVHLARTEAKSYQAYPFMIYQIQTKFRDEPRSRGGLIRVREFIMKDAYSYHTTNESLEEYYAVMHKSYVEIFKRCGLTDFISVKSDTGMMGGKVAHEFMYLNEIGEDSLIVCEHCDYRSNAEIATSNIAYHQGEDGTLEEVHTPNLKDIAAVSEFFNAAPQRAIKTTVFSKVSDGKPVIVFIRGDLKVSETKLSKIVKDNVVPMEGYYDDYNIVPGFIGPLNNNFTADCTVVFDKSLKDGVGMTAGANKLDYHILNVNVNRDLNIEEYCDVAEVNEGEFCVCCGKPLTLKRGVEIGNIFQLGTKYSASMNMTYTDADGSLKTPTMGCYGIGVGRLLACSIENHHDEYGPIWPISIAPWHVHICVLNSNVDEVLDKGFELYNGLKTSHETIIDDRKVSPGVQFADADLLGIPVRVIISKKLLEKGMAEITTRDKSIKVEVPLNEVNAEVDKIVKTLWENIKNQEDDSIKYQSIN
ncbi:MAG: proline--tRNA ligase [Lachnospirales bacterium]